ncbi:MAG TPA: hypothetical protein VND66_07420 [Acidobacteriaceae bacterium]|nr:hypothetical protein [Acidobacteriaceae bacterium]
MLLDNIRSSDRTAALEEYIPPFRAATDSAEAVWEAGSTAVGSAEVLVAGSTAVGAEVVDSTVAVVVATAVAVVATAVAKNALRFKTKKRASDKFSFHLLATMDVDQNRRVTASIAFAPVEADSHSFKSVGLLRNLS